MDNSQSSDVFSNSDCSYDSPVMMETCTYESMVSNTKQSLCRDMSIQVNKPTFPQYFASLLEDCDNCISQSLDLINSLLMNTAVELTKLQKYMTDAIQILQMMSTFTKAVIESVSMSFAAMKTFPTTTGKIIMIVFTHCKDSENLYGQNVKNVERQLKDLFKTCHELQLTYLMVLEKHFIFDLTEEEQMDVLVKALDINLKIGEIVQSLDVKTMAEQWKAYTMICEKHSSYLLDTGVYQNCAEILCSLIENNIKTAVENNQEEKMTLRSLKVASFNIKILLKICNIFKHCTVKNFGCVIELLILIHLNSGSHQDMNSQKSEQVTNLIATNVLSPMEALIRELLLDAEFLNAMIDYEDLEKDDKPLGFVLVVISLLKATLLLENESGKIKKDKLIDCLYKILRYGHIIFNMGLKFSLEPTETPKTVGLYENLLIHTLAVALTLNSEEMTFLEQRMYEAVLATDCITAMFSANLWALLSRYFSRPFKCSQLISLCNIYQKLEKRKSFSKSPQMIHLNYLIKSIFKTMHPDDQFTVYQQFKDLEKNISLWIILEFNEFLDSDDYAQNMITENVKTEFNKLFSSDIQNLDHLMRLMQLASTYNLSNDEELEAVTMRAWTKLCPNHNKAMKEVLHKQWCMEYVGALASLTLSMRSILLNSANLVQILHLVYNVMENSSTEMKFILLPVVCKICTHQVQEANKKIAYNILTNVLKMLFNETENTLRMRLIHILKQHEKDSTLNYLISETKDRNIQETWKKLKQGSKMQPAKLKQHLKAALECKYRHKCVLDQQVILLSDSSVNMERTSSKNFDFADIDTLFDAAADNDDEPACKKVKLNTNNVETCVVALETNTNMLCDFKENVLGQYKSRIRQVCEKLMNVIID